MIPRFVLCSSLAAIAIAALALGTKANAGVASAGQRRLITFPAV